jgi:hypothetical protein
MHLTRQGSVQRPLTIEPKGWPVVQTLWLASRTLHLLTGLLHRYVLQEVVTRNPKLEVSGSQTQWLAGHVARPAGQHLACYWLNQGGNSSLDPL